MAARLFLRFFLCYFVVLFLCLPLLSGLGISPEAGAVGLVGLIFVLLALLGGFLTVSGPYLLALSAAKAYYDASLLQTLISLCQARTIGFWSFNAALIFLVFSLMLYCVAAGRACVFSFHATERDLSLLLSRRCFRFLVEAALLATLSLTLYFLWPQLIVLLL